MKVFLVIAALMLTLVCGCRGRDSSEQHVGQKPVGQHSPRLGRTGDFVIQFGGDPLFPNARMATLLMT
jgi:hypothetical protein